MSVQTSHRFTVTEYHRMAETGILKPDARVELLDGRIVDMSPIGPGHGGTTNSLLRIFAREDDDQFVMSVQNPLRIDEHSEPEPDLMLLKPDPTCYRKRHPEPEDVFLLIEVADTSVGLDRTEKLAAYAKAGIGDYWLVNLSEKKVEVFRQPNFLGYNSTETFRPGDTISPSAFPDLSVSVSEILGV